jgi:DNA repair exonuclease SbcCD ATPase subunit
MAVVALALCADWAPAQTPVSAIIQQVQEAQSAPAPVTVPVSASKKEKTPLLPPSHRLAIWQRLLEVRDEIEKTESEMFKLSAPENATLVANRDRWHNELQRIQSDVRLAEKDLAEAETRQAEMEKRLTKLKEESERELATDKPLKTLQEKLAMYKERLKDFDRRLSLGSLAEKSKPSFEDSIRGEIIDAEMEIAQREESLRRSYKGGDAEQMEDELADRKADAEVKRKSKEVLVKRFEEIEALSDSISNYARLERRVEMLQILHRKLSELHAQQEVEFLRSIDPNKVKVQFEAK